LIELRSYTSLTAFVRIQGVEQFDRFCSNSRSGAVLSLLFEFR
jgi:hypothetical protein